MPSQDSPVHRIKHKVDTVLRRRTGEHTVPVFDHEASRHHRPKSLLELKARAKWWQRTGGQSTARTHSFLQFAGFPRSGHSLIGSLVDAHPDAVVSHELDVLGLLDAGWSQDEIFALIGSQSAAFMDHGRYWNGFAYVVPNQHNGRSDAPLVIGDKKGDWAVRRMQRDAGLLERLHERITLPCKWLLVVRNPFDNIATMSLRRGGAYDRLRISSPDSSAFKAALKAEAGKSIADSADDAMIDDFRSLCAGVRDLQARLPADHWLGVGYEAFARDPAAGLRRILGFLDLEDRGGFVEDAASIVRHGENRSRHSVAWSPDQIARVRDMIEEFDFLSLAEAGEP